MDPRSIRLFTPQVGIPGMNQSEESKTLMRFQTGPSLQISGSVLQTTTHSALQTAPLGSVGLVRSNSFVAATVPTTDGDNNMPSTTSRFGSPREEIFPRKMSPSKITSVGRLVSPSKISPVGLTGNGLTTSIGGTPASITARHRVTGIITSTSNVTGSRPGSTVKNTSRPESTAAGRHSVSDVRTTVTTNPSGWGSLNQSLMSARHSTGNASVGKAMGGHANGVPFDSWNGLGNSISTPSEIPSNTTGWGKMNGSSSGWTTSELLSARNTDSTPCCVSTPCVRMSTNPVSKSTAIATHIPSGTIMKPNTPGIMPSLLSNMYSSLSTRALRSPPRGAPRGRERGNERREASMTEGGFDSKDEAKVDSIRNQVRRSQSTNRSSSTNRPNASLNSVSLATPSNKNEVGTTPAKPIPTPVKLNPNTPNRTTGISGIIPNRTAGTPNKTAGKNAPISTTPNRTPILLANIPAGGVTGTSPIKNSLIEQEKFSLADSERTNSSPDKGKGTSLDKMLLEKLTLEEVTLESPHKLVADEEIILATPNREAASEIPPKDTATSRFIAKEMPQIGYLEQGEVVIETVNKKGKPPSLLDRVMDKVLDTVRSSSWSFREKDASCQDESCNEDLEPRKNSQCNEEPCEEDNSEVTQVITEEGVPGWKREECIEQCISGEQRLEECIEQGISEADQAPDDPDFLKCKDCSESGCPKSALTPCKMGDKITAPSPCKSENPSNWFDLEGALYDCRGKKSWTDNNLAEKSETLVHSANEESTVNEENGMVGDNCASVDRDDSPLEDTPHEGLVCEGKSKEEFNDGALSCPDGSPSCPDGSRENQGNRTSFQDSGRDTPQLYTYSGNPSPLDESPEGFKTVSSINNENNNQSWQKHLCSADEIEQSIEISNEEASHDVSNSHDEMEVDLSNEIPNELCTNSVRASTYKGRSYVFHPNSRRNSPNNSRHTSRKHSRSTTVAPNSRALETRMQSNPRAPSGHHCRAPSGHHSRIQSTQNSCVPSCLNSRNHSSESSSSRIRCKDGIGRREIRSTEMTSHSKSSIPTRITTKGKTLSKDTTKTNSKDSKGNSIGIHHGNTSTNGSKPTTTQKEKIASKGADPNAASKTKRRKRKSTEGKKKEDVKDAKEGQLQPVKKNKYRYLTRFPLPINDMPMKIREWQKD